MIPNVVPGSGPVVLAQPHGGTEIPDAILKRLNPEGQARADTDWHISRLYADLLADASIVSTPIHRYVIDANRDPADESLYPGQNTTSLCPTTTFDGTPIYRDGQTPSADEIEQRQRDYHQPYHDALREQLERVRQKHGYVILYDCHSIRSIVPYLFDGQLPDFNIGTNNGNTCDCGHRTGSRTSMPGRSRLSLRAQRPLQGRLDHTPLWTATTRLSRDSDGTGAMQLHAGSSALGIRPCQRAQTSCYSCRITH